MIRVGIVGYGNLGKSAHRLIKMTDDMEVVKIFTRRDPNKFDDDIFESYSNIDKYKEDIDVIFLAVGSATDIPQIAPEVVKYYNTVDSFDTHAEIPGYYDKMEVIAKENNNACLISTGWDPGLFSLQRLMAETILPKGNTYTFWGKGVSQGHSDAVRRIDGVRYAVQYTIPKEEMIKNIDKSEGDLKSFEGHLRQVFVVADDGADLDKIENEIKNMKNYFDEYETQVFFIDEKEFLNNHTSMPHGGHVIRVGETLDGNKEVIDYTLKLDSNPDFTVCVNIASIRAVYRFAKENKFGVHTILDTPPIYYSKLNIKDAVKKYL